MMIFKILDRRSKGFTLVEIIVTIVAAGILGAIFINFMGTALSSSWNAVEIARDEAGAEALMEQIIGEYVALVNGNNPDTALGTIYNNYNGTYNGITATSQYITFDNSGNENILSSGTSENLKVVLQPAGIGSPAIAGRYSLTTILTESRDINDPVCLY